MFVAIVAHAPPLLQQELLILPATRRAGNLIAALGAKRRASSAQSAVILAVCRLFCKSRLGKAAANRRIFMSDDRSRRI
jgi:hypothetical protein